MPNYNYICLNEGCTHRDLQVISKPEAEEANPEYCFGCEGELKLLGYTPSGGFLKVQAMTPEQRKQVLLKRSRAHYQKEVKDRKNEILKQAFGAKRNNNL